MSAANWFNLLFCVLLLFFSLNAAAARTISIDECMNKWCEFDNAEITEIELSFQIANGDSYEVASDQSSFINVTVTFYGSDKTKWHDSHEFHQRRIFVSNYVSYEVRPDKIENCEYKVTMGECKSAYECEFQFGSDSDGVDAFYPSKDVKYFTTITLGNSKLGTSSIGQITKFKYVPSGSISSRNAPLNFDDAASTFLEDEKANCLRIRGPPTPTSTTTTSTTTSTTLPSTTPPSPSPSTTTANNPDVPSVISNPPPPGPSTSAATLTTPSILESTSTNNPDLPPVSSNPPPPGPPEDSSSSSTPSVLESTSSTTANNPDLPSVISNPPGPSEDSSSSSAKPSTVNPDDPIHPQTVTPGSNIPSPEPVTSNPNDPNALSTTLNPDDDNESSSSNPNGPNDNNNNGSDPTCSDPNNCSTTPVSPDKKNDNKAETAEAGSGFGLTDKNTWEADENGWTGPHANRNRALIFIYGNCVILAAFFITIFAMIMGGCLFNDTSSANSPQQSVDYSEYGQLPSQQAQL